MNNILSEVKKPLTPDRIKEIRDEVASISHGTHIVASFEWAERCGQFAGELLNALVRIEALEAERRWIPVEQWMNNPNNALINVTTWHSGFAEEFPVAYFSDGAWVEWNNGGKPGDDLPKPEFVRPLHPHQIGRRKGGANEGDFSQKRRI